MIFKREKLMKSDVTLNNDTGIKSQYPEQTYKYLGINEMEGIQHTNMKEKIRKEYIRRVKAILKTRLNAKNRLTAINNLAVPNLSYSFNTA